MLRSVNRRSTVTALCGAVCLCVLAAQQPARGAGQASSLERRGVIAFEADNGLFVVNAAGGTPRRIPTSRPGDGNPRWSPDGEQLAFDRLEKGNWDVHVMNADGSGHRQLTFSRADDDFAMWSPDGRSLVFNSERDARIGSRKSVYVVSVVTGAARRVTRHGKYPDWSVDGRIFFVGGGTGTQPAYTVRPYGRDRRPLGSLEALGMKVSDDGKRLASQHGTPSDIYTARTDGTQERRVAASDEWEGDPSWSPDNDWIVYESSPNRGGPYTLYVMASNGGTRVRLTSMPGCCADWSMTAQG